MWTQGAVEKAKDAADETHSVEEMQKVFLFASKNQVNVFVSTHRQVTLWGPNGEINDYSAREWSKLTGEYYYGRWDLYFNMLFDHLDRNETLNMDEYHKKAVEFGLEWDSRVSKRRWLHPERHLRDPPRATHEGD